MRTRTLVTSQWRIFLALSALAITISTLKADVVRSTDSTHWGLDSLDGIRDGSFHQTLTGAGVNIYVIDTGVRSTHADFKDALGNSRVTYVGDFCNSTALGGAPRTTSLETPYDDGYDGHGTHNASYAAGNLSGAAKDAKIFSLRAQGHDGPVLDPDCGEDANQAAMTWAVKWVTQHGIKPAVVNISFCGFGTGSLSQAIDASTAAGFVYTLSGCTGGDVIGHWGASVVNEALVVGGIRSDNTRLAPNDYDSALALYAPSAGMTGAGRGVAPEGSGGDNDYSIPENCCGNGPGDSFAAPMAAGVAALYLQAHPTASPAEVRMAVISAAAAGVVVNPGNSFNFLLQSTEAPDTNWRVGAIADFNGDGKADVIWQHQRTGLLDVWMMNGITRSVDVTPSPQFFASSPWQIVGSGDFNHDGHTDLVWWNPNDGHLVVWYMNGAAFISAADMSPANVADTNWVPVAVGDFDGDGQPDLVWWNKTSGAVGVWYMNGVTQSGSVNTVPYSVPDTQWHLIGAADFNGDGHPDLFWEHVGTGALAIWYMNNVTQTGGANPPGVADHELARGRAR